MARKQRNILRSRFTKGLNDQVEAYVASISFDRRLYKQDIAGSIAHVEMLSKQGIISSVECELITSGLLSIQTEIESSKFVFDSSQEDIHMSIENRLFEKIGDVAAKLHTARSRNDQIALDERLYVRQIIDVTMDKIKELQRTLLESSKKNIDAIMPGFTHLQHAQPVLFAHYLLAYFEMFKRDVERFEFCLKHVNISPLGSGAIAGVTFPIDRSYIARKLGFDDISRNSIDAVSDRDFILEYEAAASICMIHLSRMAEDFVIWSTSEFHFIEIDEAFCTSSSMMPQKKNDDVLELIRGKSGRVIGSLMGLLTVLKGLPLTYNRDLQEDKESLFDIVDTLIPSVELMREIIDTLIINTKNMQDFAEKDFILATDLADYLVKKGLAFREAHTIVGNLVKYSQENAKNFKELNISEYRKFSALFEKDIYEITVESSIDSRDVPGGTAKRQVVKSLRLAEKELGLSEK